MGHAAKPAVKSYFANGHIFFILEQSDCFFYPFSLNECGDCFRVAEPDEDIEVLMKGFVEDLEKDA